MKPMLRCLSVLFVLSVLAAPAAAQLTVVTDRTTYAVGDVVAITIHNAGPGAAMFVSFPPYSIRHIESGECLYGCAGMPEIRWLQAGETIPAAHDTGILPDPTGHYRIDLAGTSDVPGSILSVGYELTVTVGREETTWSGVKGLYR